MTTFRRTTKDEERAGKLVNALYGRGNKKKDKKAVSAAVSRPPSVVPR